MLVAIRKERPNSDAVDVPNSDAVDVQRSRRSSIDCCVRHRYRTKSNRRFRKCAFCEDRIDAVEVTSLSVSLHDFGENPLVADVQLALDLAAWTQMLSARPGHAFQTCIA